MALHKVSWSPEAIEDLRSIAEQLGKNSPHFAKTVAAKLCASARNLGTFPDMGKAVPGMGGAAKEVVAYGYRLIYHVAHYQVLVAAIVPTKR